MSIKIVLYIFLQYSTIVFYTCIYTKKNKSTKKNSTTYLYFPQLLGDYQRILPLQDDPALRLVVELAVVHLGVPVLRAEQPAAPARVVVRDVQPPVALEAAQALLLDRREIFELHRLEFYLRVDKKLFK